ncbi:MAG TPA: hypothetical protein VNL96_05600, partial [Gemmatimonadaceae bacterium]|nr:hypothetical protein [Gemmatimonadaceae bacterium]
RFGPGPKTAVMAGLVPFIATSLVLYGLSAMGLFTYAFYWKATALSLVVVVAGSIAGAWAYKEA